jgi:tRNA A37 threonylcarbamoyladenosine synthetase subunit TsaC/SUA5/YrdC
VKIIKVPADVVVKLPGVEEGKAFPFKEALILHLDSYVELKTISQSREASKIIDAIEKGNGTISLEDAQYAILSAACKNRVYHQTITRQLLSYYDAVDGATGA